MAVGLHPVDEFNKGRGGGGYLCYMYSSPRGGLSGHVLLAILLGLNSCVCFVCDCAVVLACDSVDRHMHTYTGASTGTSKQ